MPAATVNTPFTMSAKGVKRPSPKSGSAVASPVAMSTRATSGDNAPLASRPANTQRERPSLARAYRTPPLEVRRKTASSVSVTRCCTDHDAEAGSYASKALLSLPSDDSKWGTAYTRPAAAAIDHALYSVGSGRPRLLKSGAGRLSKKSKPSSEPTATLRRPVSPSARSTWT